MSVETLIAATEASVATAATPAPSPSAAPPVTPTPAEEPKAPATPEGQPEPAEPIEETEPNIEEVPEGSGDFQKFKSLFKEHPELRNIIGREKAFSELGPFSDVKAIVERIPTVEDAETLTSQADNHKLMGQTFREDVPSFVESLKESDPLAYQNFTARLPEVLRETDPAAFSEQARIYTNHVMTNVLLAAQQSGDDKFLEAAQLMAQFLGIRPGAALQPAENNSENARLRRQIQEREQNDAQRAFESFWTQTDAVIEQNGIAEIQKQIKQVLPNVTEKQLARITGEIWDGTLESLGVQPQFVSEINKFRANAQKGRQGIVDHKAIVDFASRRAKLVIPKVAKDVISEWSKEVLRLNQETNDKKKGIAASTKDVGTGPQGTTSAAASSATGNGKPRSIGTIFEQIESGNYVKK